jgi:uncharacterized protein (TIGR02611 family)
LRLNASACGQRFLSNRIEKNRETVSKIWPLLRKCLVVLVGFPLLLLGIVMIPLPGPGLLICVGALFVLALEFEWARRHLHSTRTRLNGVMDRVAAGRGGVGQWWRRWRAKRGRSDKGE